MCVKLLKFLREQVVECDKDIESEIFIERSNLKFENWLFDIDCDHVDCFDYCSQNRSLL